MRVTHVITRLIIGGAQENTIASILGLRDRYHLDARLVSGRTTGPEGSLEDELAPHSGLLTIIPALVRPVHPWKDWMAGRALVRLFREQRPDIVHTHSGKAGFLGRLAAHRAGIPVVVHTIHGPSFGSFQGAIPNAIFLPAERIAGRVTTHFVSVADALTRQYLAAGIGAPDRYTRIFSGFDLQPFLAVKNDPAVRARFGITPGDFVIGKIARLFKLKGHDDLISAASRIVEGCPNAKFLLVGDGEWRSRLERRTQQIGLAGHFVFAGLVPPAEVPSLIGIMDLLVHLSRREGLARALPQALAAGKPVITYNCDGANEVCREGETGFLISPGDLGRFASCVLRLAEEPSERAAMGRRGRSLVRECFSTERMVEDLNHLYKRLLAAQSQPRGLVSPKGR